MMKNIPNIITCLNLFAGCLACVMAFNGSFEGALIFIIIAAVLDFFDGFAARMLKAYSAIGKELDSLADVISFGMAPGVILYSFLQQSANELPWGWNITFLAFLIPIFSAVRLAKFNIDERQTTSFLGLPVPANALFWGSLIPWLHAHLMGNKTMFSLIVLTLEIIFCLLMISEIPMFSLKFKNYSWKGNEIRFILIILMIAFVCIFGLQGICLGILTYIFMSFLTAKKRQ